MKKYKISLALASSIILSCFLCSCSPAEESTVSTETNGAIQTENKDLSQVKSEYEANEKVQTDSEDLSQNHREAEAPDIIEVPYEPYLFTLVPDEYIEPAEKYGTIVRLDYHVDAAGTKYTEEDKYALVYLPHGYRESDTVTRYNILYLMHGGGGNANTLFGGQDGTTYLKNILDHMIEKGDIDPMIVVTPTYFRGGNSDDASLTADFHGELVNNLIPAVEGTFHGFALSTDAGSLQAARGHRAFGGFSMGSVTTWYTLIHCLDYFTYFLPMSGDSWALGQMSGGSMPAETAAYLHDIILNSHYQPDEYFIFSCTGTQDMAYEALSAQIEAMREYPDTFIDTDNFATGNFHYCIAENGTHDYDYAYQYLYNALPTFFFTNDENTSLKLSNMMVRITSQKNTATFQLYDTGAAKEFYQQLPLELEISNFRNAQWMFYPPQPLNVTSAEAYHDGKKGELSYYQPWGDVFMLYEDFYAGDEMHRLGVCTGGIDDIAGMSGSIMIEKEETPVINQEDEENMELKINVQANEYAVVFELNGSQAARDLYNQLPLTIAVENYSNNEKIFYPPQKLNISQTPQANAKAGTLAYYAPWGDVVMFYRDFGSASGLYTLGNAVSGLEMIEQISGMITISKIE